MHRKKPKKRKKRDKKRKKKRQLLRNKRDKPTLPRKRKKKSSIRLSRKNYVSCKKKLMYWLQIQIDELLGKIMPMEGNSVELGELVSIIKWAHTGQIQTLQKTIDNPIN